MDSLTILHCILKFVRDPFLDKHLKCKWLYHENSFLKIGPFKLESKHINPQIAEVHDLISEKYANKLINKARGRLKPTPYSVKGKQKDFSKLRTSKIMYINEKYDQEALCISKRIEYVTRMKLSHERFASENFQVMNYGIGGKIAPHLDSCNVTRILIVVIQISIKYNHIYCFSTTFKSIWKRTITIWWTKIHNFHAVFDLSRGWRTHNFPTGRNFRQTSSRIGFILV